LYSHHIGILAWRVIQHTTFTYGHTNNKISCAWREPARTTTVAFDVMPPPFLENVPHTIWIRRPYSWLHHL
jgi:hypothetical protein